ncbi:MAG TPA: substrate-binding domain-containing protein [Fimbriimonadaceae bacterium]|nr:substrate-binding domain-containing protein [Fimbriimonadaceae bacterium]
MKRVSILLALAALFVAGCNGGDQGAKTDNGGTSTTGSDAGGAKTFKITMIAKSSTNPVFLSARTGAEDAAKKLGPDYKANVQIDWQTPDKEDGQVQAQNIQAAISQHSDAILISCSDAAKVTGAIDDAVKAGIPVMTFDSDAPDSKRFAYYGVDDEETGKLVMDTLAKQVGGKGNVAILAGNQNAPNLQKRVKGVEDAAKAYPGIKIVDVVHHVETPEDASSAVVAEMNAHPDITAWAMVGGWPLFATSLLTELPSRHVKVVSVDALPKELAYVDAGIAPELLAQPTYKWGYESVRIILDKCVAKKDVPVVNKMDLVPVTKESLGSWARQLKEWGMDVDQKYLDMK